MARRILVTWNQVEEDVYEHLRAEGINASVTTIDEELTAIVDAVRANGHHCTLVNIKNQLPALLDAIDDERPDAIFNLVEFFGADPAHEAHLAGVYELLGVAYTGARPAALALCQRKHRAKALLAQAGLPTPPYFVVSGRAGDVRPPDDHGLTFPLIVKPALEDASSGIDEGAVVHDAAALDARVTHVLTHHAQPVLIEEYIDGRELHCALLGDHPATPLPLYEMMFTERLGADGQPLPKIVTYRAKWDPTSRDFLDVDGRCPVPDLEPEIVEAIQDVAVRAARVVGVRDYARVDMRLDTQTGEPFILEVNPNPDLAEHGAFMQCAIASGRTFVQTIGEIVAMALARADLAPRRAPDDVLLREALERRARRRPPTLPPRKS